MKQTDFNTAELFTHLLNVMTSERFLKMQGLNSDVPFFICPFPVKMKLEVEDMIPLLVQRLASQNIEVLNLNIYDLCLDELKKENLLEPLLDVEPETEKGYFLESLQSMLDVEEHITPAVKEKLGNHPRTDILFLTGIGEVFPYVRAHSLLNNLQNVAKRFPSVLFFPGRYEHSLEQGASLQLFGKLPCDKYYRAFDITRCEY